MIYLTVRATKVHTAATDDDPQTSSGGARAHTAADEPIIAVGRRQTE
jgi:hypothetical protein